MSDQAPPSVKEAKAPPVEAPAQPVTPRETPVAPKRDSSQSGAHRGDQKPSTLLSEAMARRAASQDARSPAGDGAAPRSERSDIREKPSTLLGEAMARWVGNDAGHTTSARTEPAASATQLEHT